MKKFYLFLFILVAGILIGTVIFFKFWNRPSKDMRERKPDYSYTTDMFSKLFSTNPMDSGRKYINKIIVLKGVPDEIETDRQHNMHFFFSQGKITLQCTLEKGEHLPALNKNKPEIVLKGSFAGIDTLLGTTVKLYNCVVLNR